MGNELFTFYFFVFSPTLPAFYSAFPFAQVAILNKKQRWFMQLFMLLFMLLSARVESHEENKSDQAGWCEEGERTSQVREVEERIKWHLKHTS